MTTIHGSDLQLEYSHNIIEHLGLKLYQNKPTNVIAELVSNAWDADAENAWLDINDNKNLNPGDRYICVMDDGYGMDPHAIKDKYLVIGLKKRKLGDPNELSINKKRMLMGRKGIGKLAPFGIAGKLSVITAYKSNEETKVSVFSLNISGLLDPNNESHTIQHYKPEVIFFDEPLSHVDEHYQGNNIYNKFRQRIANSGSGTAIVLTNIKQTNSISLDKMTQSIGRRFTVAFSKEDFHVFINDKLVEAVDSLPKFDVRYPKDGYDTEVLNIGGIDREIKFWVGFVYSADWPQDEAGVGVYAHGKIAQDRPFFFSVKGKEIYTRYMYGVVEADWLDELDEDVISTDRTTINWEAEQTIPLHEFCHGLVKKWIEKYRKDINPGARDKIIEIMESTPDLPKVTTSERDAIVNLVHQLGPKVHKDKTVQVEVVKAMTASWTHKPMQVLIKKLWDAFDISSDDTDSFTNSLKSLNEHLVPESLSMSVIQAQRIYALSKLYNLKNNGNENQLQALLEAFPWILGTEMENLRPNQTLKENAAEAAKIGLIPSHGFLREEMAKDRNANLRPDFVFFSNEGETKIVVVELKSPQVPLEIKHRSQLSAYLDWFETQYPNAEAKGILIGQNAQAMPAMRTNIEILCWEQVYLKSRRDHLELLAAMLHGVSEHYDDTRVKDVMAMGGEQTKALLSKMASAHSPLRDLFEDTDKVIKNKESKSKL
ncbi:ATP-binding protein [Cronobacter sakazakii]|nr:ATP-binding protein [Cronobacter sakazakii]EKK7675990.1 ATP-binding protein [Cronobacter sakazakii]